MSNSSRKLSIILKVIICHIIERVKIRRDKKLQVIIFSKDRACQLDLLLRSWKKNGIYSPRVSIIWHATTTKHERAYKEVIARHLDIVKREQKERQFREDLLQIIASDVTDRIMFMVDDLVLRVPFDFAALENLDPLCAVPSLRLGPDINYSQVQDHYYNPPTMNPTSNGWLRFTWGESAGYWAMPLSVDGHVFNRREIQIILNSSSFKAPNSLEHCLGPYRFLFRWRAGFCRPNPPLLNLAINRVQKEEFDFPHGEIDSEQLLEKWRSGLQIDLNSVEQLKANSCHVVVEPKFSPRS